MNFNPDLHNRKSLRLKEYDYSSEWLYFITISIKDKLCLFWEIKDNELTTFDSGKMIEKYWIEIENDFDNIKLQDYVIMPNHFHWIIEIKKQNINCNCKICLKNNTCRDTPCGYPNKNLKNYNWNIVKNYFLINENNDEKKDTHKGCPYNRNLLWNIIGQFKSKTTNEYIKNVHENNWPIFNNKLWQKDFYEHIIRNEESFLKISKYIKNNVSKWDEDKFYYTEI